MAAAARHAVRTRGSSSACGWHPMHACMPTFARRPSSSPSTSPQCGGARPLPFPSCRSQRAWRPSQSLLTSTSAVEPPPPEAAAALHPPGASIKPLPSWPLPPTPSRLGMRAPSAPTALLLSTGATASTLPPIRRDGDGWLPAAEAGASRGAEGQCARTVQRAWGGESAGDIVHGVSRWEVAAADRTPLAEAAPGTARLSAPLPAPSGPGPAGGTAVAAAAAASCMFGCAGSDPAPGPSPPPPLGGARRGRPLPLSLPLPTAPVPQPAASFCCQTACPG